MNKVLLALLITLLTVTSAPAFFISFDQSGSGNDANLVLMDEWQMNTLSEFNTDAGQVGDVFTYQTLSTGAFTESFTMRITEGRNSSLAAPFDVTDFVPDLFADVQLNGTYFSDSNIQFNGGSIQVYKELAGAFGNFDAGDTDIATLDLTSALTSQLSGALLGAQDLAMRVDLNFEFDTVNPLFWGQTEEDLTDLGWLVSVVGGRIDEDYVLVLGQDQVLIEWDLPGFQAEFAVVPEPSTFALIGLGIAGLAFCRRRKS